MYNLFVTSQLGAWERPFYEFDRGRFLEYTNNKIAARFEDLKPRKISSLLKLPCLFAYEGKDNPLLVGKLTAVKPRGRLLLIEYQIDLQVPPIPFDKIDPIRPLLDIRDWELHRTHWAIKDEDLADRLRTAGLIAGASIPSTANYNELPAAELDRCEISSVSDFIKEVLALHTQGAAVFYRGHSKQQYRLEPSLFRRDASGNYRYLDNEDRLYRELIVSNSVDFEGDIYTLDRLVRMQHYSLPTRLLDITSNPLIGLYFACHSHFGRLEQGKYIDEVPGEVILLSMDSGFVKYFDSDTASCIANLARLPKAEKDSIDFEISDEILFNGQLSIKRLLHLVREEKPFFEPRIQGDDLKRVVCVKGKKTNSRISFQSGAFLLFGQDAILDEMGSPEIRVERLVIKNKKLILDQLDLLNINESTVFPNIDSSARYIARKYSFHPS